VGVASGTAALELSLRACEIGGGDEVITTAHTFFATAEAISNVGATPVFADIDPATFNLDPDAVESSITPRTRAVIPVHLYGRPADLDALVDICRRHGLRLIEDAAQAHGARSRGRACGTVGDLACFSFYPGKNLGAYGDAGAVTGDPSLLARIRKLRDHGRSSKYEHDEVGYGERLDALQAAVLGVKLRHLEDWTEARRRHAATYDRLLAGSSLVTPSQDPRDRHVFHLYVVRSLRRDDLLASLTAAGIGAGVHYPIPLHRQPAYEARGYGDCRLPAAEAAAGEVLSLPLYPELTDEQIGSVVAEVRQFSA
jgi:dTDP-4-amino-4,6-dideoxygalactose transaminase